MEKIELDLHYHAHCQDGLGAVASALVGLKELKCDDRLYVDSRDRKINQGLNLEEYDPNGRLIIYMDYCPVPEELERVSANNLVIILDHHKTSENTLRGNGGAIKTFREALDLHHNGEKGLFVIFDMQRSGAGISWDFFNPERARPKLLNVIEKRDLWDFSDELTEPISTFLFSLELTADELAKMFEEETLESFCKIAERSCDVLRYKSVIVQDLSKGKHYVQNCCGDNLVFCNSQTLHSDLGNYLLEISHRSRLAVIYHVNTYKKFIKLSLRGNQGDSFARKVAERLGGGGHDSASGAQIPDTLDVCEVMKKVLQATEEVTLEYRASLDDSDLPF